MPNYFQYEMIHAYVVPSAETSTTASNLEILKQLISRFNKFNGMNLTLNYTHMINTVHSSNRWNRIDDGIEMNDFEISVVHILDDEQKNDSLNESGFDSFCDDGSKVLTKKLNNDDVGDSDYVQILVKYFIEDYIKRVEPMIASNVKCLLCLAEIKCLAAHLDQDCAVFKSSN